MAAATVADNGTYICTLSPALIEKAKTELNEKPEWRSRDIQALRDMVLAHKGLKCRTDDAFLLRFLRAKKFDYDRAYQQLLNLYQIRAENDDILKEIKPSAVPEAIDACVSMILPKRDKLGRKILYFRPAKWDPSKFSLYDLLRVNIMNIELAIQDEETQVNGLIAIGNLDGVGWLQAKNMERNYFKIMTSLLQEAFPARFKGMHAINEPAVFGYIFALVKPFLKEKMTSRMNFHGSDMEGLYKNFDLEALPEELGGKLPSGDVLGQEWKKTLLAHESMFEDMMQYHLELPRQISRAKLQKDTDCIVGTYKKLNID